MMKFSVIIFLLMLPLALFGSPLNTGKRVIYVPGWFRSGSDPSDNFASLATVFPDSILELRPWDSDRLPFSTCRDNADAEGLALAKRLQEMSPEERSRVVLVGHSLGARVVIRAMAVLAAARQKIARGVVLAAAIPWDDEDLNTAADASEYPFICVCSQRDYTLKYLYGTGGESGNQALGINGWGGDTANVVVYFMPEFVPDIVIPDAAAMNFAVIRGLSVHLAKFYLEFLAQYRDYGKKEIVVRQDFPNPPTTVIDAEIWWEVLDKSEGWKLEQHIITGHCRILDPDSVRRAWGDSRAMYDSFDYIRKQQAERRKP